MYAALDIAKYVVTKCIDEEEPISNLQLQKILYYIQRYFLQNKNMRAFPDTIEAWQFGPVVPKVYYHFCMFGAMKITTQYHNLDVEIAQQDKTIIDSIVVEKRALPAWTLVEDTHKENGAWAKTYRNGEGNRGIIEPELIKAVG